MEHVNRSDEEIIALCGVNLVFLSPTVCGIIRDIRTPQPETNPPPPWPTGQSSKWDKKVTCWDSAHGCKTSDKHGKGRGHGSHVRRSQTLSESRWENFGISSSNITSLTVRSSRQPIDYLTLNDGYEDETPDNPKWRCKDMYGPQSGPSANRLAAHKWMSSPESVVVEDEAPAATLSAIPSTSGDGETLTGVPIEDQKLPDFEVNQNEPGTAASKNVEESEITVNTVSTEEDLEAASTLLSLGDTRDDMLEDDDENTQLMPIGGVNVPEDIAPEPLRLDQVSVDNVIAGIVEMEELEKDLTAGETSVKPAATVVPLPDKGDQADNEPAAMKG